jgi:ubiquinone/menaquinone biosynthesis C-methylase UbiE/uncharacterized protein YbaR (Trm112 family)
MKRSFAAELVCVGCGSGGLELEVAAEDEREVREGELSCGACGARYTVRAGIPDFIDPTDEVLAREVAGWIELAGPLGEDLVPVMTALPYFPHEPWPHVAPDFFQIFEEVDFADARVVDLGAGRTWSSRFLATLGRAAEVVAVDVLTTRFLGLETADLYMQQDGNYFERLRADGHHLPLPDGWADAIFSCAAIHHSSHIDVLFREAARVLRPGGTLVFVSEPAKSDSVPGNKPDNEETRAGINENFYSLREYERALEQAGFRHRRLVPRSIHYRLRYPDQNLVGELPRWLRPLFRGPRGQRTLLRLLRGRLTGSWVYRRWSLPLSMIASNG